MRQGGATTGDWRQGPAFLLFVLVVVNTVNWADRQVVPVLLPAIQVDLGLGDVKKVHAREAQIRTWAFRSVVSVRPIAAGATITEDDVWTKRPGTGIPSKRLHEVIGRTAKHAIPSGRLVAWEDLV